MRAKMCCVVVSLLVVGADTSPGSIGVVGLELPIGSRWEVVQGYEASRRISVGCLTIQPNRQLQLIWITPETKAMSVLSGRIVSESASGGMRVDSKGTRDIGAGYQELWGKVKVAPVGNHLEVRVPSLIAGPYQESRSYGNAERPKNEGELYLLFKRVK